MKTEIKKDGLCYKIQRAYFNNTRRKYNTMITFILFFTALGLLTPGHFVTPAFSQAECTAWGNVTGIRVDGQLMEFETSLRLLHSNRIDMRQTAKEQQRPRYSRDGNKQTIKTKLDFMSITKVVQDAGPGEVSINVQFTSESDTTITGAYFCIELPGKYYEGGTMELTGISSGADKQTLSAVPAFGRRGRQAPEPSVAKGASFISPRRQLEVTLNKVTEIFIIPDMRRVNNTIPVYFTVMTGEVKKGQTGHLAVKLKANGQMDKKPVELVLDTSSPGRVFDGIGGNFRLQNPDKDPQVIQYCLDNLNVTWGRVEMPWRYWHPSEDIDPIAAARSGQLNDRVREAMEMAQRLTRKNIPVIVSAWSAPSWAIEGEFSWRRQPGELRGNPLDQAKMASIIKSIGSYFNYLKEVYGVEAVLFSFNESDLGINVRQTGEQHADLIKRLGAHLASVGLNTKMLLGDNSDATTYGFIRPALENPETHKYIGAVSFHSWRGCSDWILSIWADAARTLNVPLLVGEGSTDAAAHRYPDVFWEPSYSLNEIELYLRIYSICQPVSILQWQLTTDYSVMAGDGIYNSKGPLRPTQRFWNLKQLGSTPPRAFSLPVTCMADAVTCAAFGDIANGRYAVHIVNNGAARQATLTGIPTGVKEMNVYVTNSERDMERTERVRVSNGKVQFSLESAAFTSLITP